METLLFLFPGDRPSFGAEEVRALAEVYGLELEPVVSHQRFLIARSRSWLADIVLQRAALVRVVGIGVQIVPRLPFPSTLQQLDFDALMGDSRTYYLEGVRVDRKQTADTRLMTVLQELGKQILFQTGKRVSAARPDCRLFVVISKQWVVVARKKGEIRAKFFKQRCPKYRKFRHPAAMDPITNRWMVNVARVKKGDLLLDPFCGTGGVLIEAALLGVKPLGVDLDPRMVRGSIENLKMYGLHAEVVRGDARYLPVRSADGVATDPPYGRHASTWGATLRELLRKLFTQLRGVLRHRGYAVVAAPQELPVRVLAAEAGLEYVWEGLQYVHGGLTRRFVILRNM